MFEWASELSFTVQTTHASDAIGLGNGHGDNAGHQPAGRSAEELSRLSMEQFTRPSITLSTLELLSSDHFYLQMGNFAPQMKRNFCKSGMKCKGLDFTKPSRESAELLWKISSKATFSNNSNWPSQFPILCPERMCLIAFHGYQWFLISGYIPSTNFW